MLNNDLLHVDDDEKDRKYVVNSSLIIAVLSEKSCLKNLVGSCPIHESRQRKCPLLKIDSTKGRFKRKHIATCSRSYSSAMIITVENHTAQVKVVQPYSRSWTSNARSNSTGNRSSSCTIVNDGTLGGSSTKEETYNTSTSVASGRLRCCRDAESNVPRILSQTRDRRPVYWIKRQSTIGAHTLKLIVFFLRERTSCVHFS